MAVKLSFSKISTYIECPRKYFLSYVCKMGTGSSPHMSNGSAIHKCCEDFVDWKDEDKTLENLMEYYYKILPETDKDNLVHHLTKHVDPETGEIVEEELIVNPTFEEKAVKSLKSFYEDYTENYYKQDREEDKPKIKLQEEWFNLKLGEPDEDGEQHQIRGLIDRVDDEIEGEHIIDYKSGQSRVTFKALKDPMDIKSMQLSIYALARWRKTGHIPHKSSFFYLEPAKNRKKQEGQYRSAPERTEEQLLKLEHYLTQIADEIDEATKNSDFDMGPSPNCFWCDFQKNCEILADHEISKRKEQIQIDNDPNSYWD